MGKLKNSFVDGDYDDLDSDYAPPHLIIVRGLPGSGKSTYASSLGHKFNMMRHFESDQFFVDSNGQYHYNISLIGAAHDWCYGNVVKSLRDGYNTAVSNTFTKMWEIDKYLAIPFLLPDVKIKVIEMRTQYQNIHSVPEDKLKVMARRWEQIPQEWIDDGLDFTVIE